VEPKDLITILKALPKTRLRIFPLAHELVGEDGKVDPKKIAFYQKELEEAVEEAKAYSEATKEAVRCLIELGQS